MPQLRGHGLIEQTEAILQNVFAYWIISAMVSALLARQTGRLIGVLYNDSFKMLHGQESMQEAVCFFSKLLLYLTFY